MAERQAVSTTMKADIAKSAKAITTPANKKATLRERTRYWFDKMMSRGLWGLLGLALLGTALMLLVVVPLILTLQMIFGGEGSWSDFPSLFWSSFVSVIGVGDGEGTWWEQFGAITLAVIAIFFTSTVLAAILEGITEKLADLRAHGGQIIATNHTVVIGWSGVGDALLEQLAIANQNQKKPVIAILTSDDKVELEESIDHDRCLNSEVVVRSGDRSDPSSFDLVRLADARCVVVLGSWGSETHDQDVILSLMALARYREEHPEFTGTVTAALMDQDMLAAARQASKYDSTVIDMSAFLSRLMLRTAIQPGLFTIYTDLFSFEGDEIYLTDSRPELAGHTFGEAAQRFPTSTLIGLQREGISRMHPPEHVALRQDDRLFVITEDDDTAVTGQPAPINEDALSPLAVAPDAPARHHESQASAVTSDTAEVDGLVPSRHWLFIGYADTQRDIIQQLDDYSVSPIDLTVIVPEDQADAAARLAELTTRNVRLNLVEWPDTQRAREMLDAADLPSQDYVIIFHLEDSGDNEDANTLLVKLLARDVLSVVPEEERPVLVAELLGERLQRLSDEAEATSVVVNSQTVSRILAQLTETPELLPLFIDLCDSDGSELYLKPVTRYVKPDIAVNFATVTEAARRRGEIAIGYRQHANAGSASESFGIVINPKKAAEVTFDAKDTIIVISEDDS